MDLQEVEWGGIDWIYLAKERGRWLELVRAVIMKCVEFLGCLRTSYLLRKE